jgi:hypothetical protein
MSDKSQVKFDPVKLEQLRVAQDYPLESGSARHKNWSKNTCSNPISPEASIKDQEEI